MGCLEEFDPSPAVEYWMNDKNRRPHSSETSREEDGVFEEAGRNTQINPIKL